ncbi:hypothetical protein BDA96_10G333400 [Sorghum bicolor]|uniref:Uncharacterized protein n=1 Tax=Sorghum bicolor TaxID=4558 RepID=A0A921Q6N4_SORBI|nr:hypothetical protein BDA96_10G333400 [Sorghum bicolor]
MLPVPGAEPRECEERSIISDAMPADACIPVASPPGVAQRNGSASSFGPAGSGRDP